MNSPPYEVSSFRSPEKVPSASTFASSSGEHSMRTPDRHASSDPVRSSAPPEGVTSSSPLARTSMSSAAPVTPDTATSQSPSSRRAATLPDMVSSAVSVAGATPTVALVGSNADETNTTNSNHRRSRRRLKCISYNDEDDEEEEAKEKNDDGSYCGGVPDDDDTTSEDQDWQPSKKRKSSARKNTSSKKKNKAQKEKVSKAEEQKASDEIDRLLTGATHDFASTLAPQKSSRRLDPNKTLAAAKKKLGSPLLLELLQDKMCSVCNDRLGLLFVRGYQGKPFEKMGSKCCRCYRLHSNRDRGDFTCGQAAAAMRAHSLSHLLPDEPAGTVQSGHWTRGAGLYDSFQVTQAAVEYHGSVSDLHVKLALYHKRTRKKRDNLWNW